MDMSLSKLWELVMDREACHAACSIWGRKELDMTEQLNWTEKPFGILELKFIRLNFPDSPVVKKLRTQHRGHSFHAWSSKIPNAE